MKCLALALSAGLLIGVAVGCNYSGPEHAKQMELDAKWAGKVKPTYIEIPKDGKIYVVGSQKTADLINSGGKLSQKVAAFGYGPNGETVYFEANKDGIEDLLMKEYEQKHPQAKA